MAAVQGESQEPTILGLGIAFPIIATVAVALRFHARKVKGQNWESDDWTILVALILGIGVTINLLIMTELGGLGSHIQYATEESMLIFGKTTYALEILTWPALGMTKISVLLLYRRIFATRRFKMLTWALIGLNILWVVAFTFALMFSCMPIQSHWDQNVEGTCVDEPKLFTVALGTDVATDVCVLVLPVYKVWQLQLPLERKLVIIFMFLLGGLVSVMGAIRVSFLTQTYYVLEHQESSDVTWHYATTFYWTIIETNVGVLSACLPTLRPIQESFMRSAFYTRLQSSFSNLMSSRSSKSKRSDIPLGSVEEGLNYDRKQTSIGSYRPILYEGQHR